MTLCHLCNRAVNLGEDHSCVIEKIYQRLAALERQMRGLLQPDKPTDPQPAMPPDCTHPNMVGMRGVCECGLYVRPSPFCTLAHPCKKRECSICQEKPAQTGDLSSRDIVDWVDKVGGSFADSNDKPAPPDPYKEFKDCLAGGGVVQFMFSDGSWRDGTANQLDFTAPPSRYRIARPAKKSFATEPHVDGIPSAFHLPKEQREAMDKPAQKADEESRTRRLARQCGHEHSQSVVQALDQMANEVAQEWQAKLQDAENKLIEVNRSIHDGLVSGAIVANPAHKAEEGDGPADMRRIASCLTYNGSKAEGSAKHLLLCAAMKTESLKKQLADAKKECARLNTVVGNLHVDYNSIVDRVTKERDDLKQQLTNAQMEGEERYRCHMRELDIVEGLKQQLADARAEAAKGEKT